MGLRISIAFLLVLLMVFPQAVGGSTEMERFFHSGDGFIHLIGEKNGRIFSGRYRTGQGRYDEKAYEKISALFGAPYRSKQRILSLRLIEFLDFLEDRLKPGGAIIITSGYRAPQYNTKLRRKGALAAKASLHQYGMAADVILKGVSSKRVWDYVRSLGFGGTGYYHGRTVHVDVGPARFWDEKSSGVGTGLSDDNKLIGLVTDYDIYKPAETLTLRFIRMTAFPIKVHAEFAWGPARGEGRSAGEVIFTPQTLIAHAGKCMTFETIDEMAALQWSLPTNAAPGKYRIRVRFCDNPWPDMPAEVITPEFEIRSP